MDLTVGARRTDLVRPRSFLNRTVRPLRISSQDIEVALNENI
jgi:hypothetical protein